MVVSEQPESVIGKILTVDELENLGAPEQVREIPEAQVVEWEDGTAVATPSFSIAGSMDRFLAGNLSDLQENTLEGFHSEFSEGGNKVVYADEDIRSVVGDQAVARVYGIGEFSVDVRPPEDALEVIRDYDKQYAGYVDVDFWDRIDSRNAVVPVVYNQGGVVPQTHVALMESEGMVPTEDTLSSEEILDREIESSNIGQELQTERYEAPDDSEAEYVVDVILPQGYDEVGYATVPTGLMVEVDGEQHLENLPGDFEVDSYRENNGVCSFELK